jgi:hypothetical protein
MSFLENHEAAMGRDRFTCGESVPKLMKLPMAGKILFCAVFFSHAGDFHLAGTRERRLFSSGNHGKIRHTGTRRAADSGHAAG